MELIDPHADCKFWGLNSEQCFRHHLRLAEHYVKQARKYINRAEEHSRKAARSTRWASFILGLATTLAIVLAVL